MLFTVMFPSEVRFCDVEKMAYRLVDGVRCDVVSATNVYTITYKDNHLSVMDKLAGEVHTALTERDEQSIAKALISIWQDIAWLL